MKLIILSTFNGVLQKNFCGTAIAIFGNLSRVISFLGDSRSIFLFLFFIFHIIKELPNKNAGV